MTPSRRPTTRRSLGGRAARGAAWLVDAALLLLAALALALVAVQIAVPVLGGTAVVVTGGSMEPTLPLGSLVVASRVDPATLRVGDVVTIRTGRAALVTHRITRLASLAGVAYVETKGDANGQPDPVITPVSDVVGRVAVAVPVAGRVAMAMARPLAWIAFASVIGALWMLGGLLRRPMEPARRAPAAGRPAERPAERGGFVADRS